MIRLAAFADEIAADIDTQIAVCKQHEVMYFEMRSVDKVNVIDLSDDQRKEIKQKLADNGMGVASIGSPIGKVKIDQPWSEHVEKFKRAIDAAVYFDAPFIRVFSYYPPEGGDILQQRDEVIRRMSEKADMLSGVSATMVHENEKGIYGEKGKECLDIMQSVNSPKLQTAFDFANFVQAGEKPIDNWPLLKSYTAHIHIKDALMGSGKVVPAGHGDGQIEEILKDAGASGYSGFLSLEPHLRVAGHSHGETGPELFQTAADALKAVCAKVGITLTK